MRVLVTGGAGYVGTMAAAYLLQQGFEVSVFDNCLFGAHHLIAFSDFPFRFIQGDIRDPHAVFAAMKGIDAVVHLAAVVGEAACLVDPTAARSINLEGAKITLAASQQCDVERFIFISTCSNYGISTPNTLTTEESPLNPLTDYAISKTLAEQAILASETSLITTILRFGTICGLSPKMRFDLLVNDLSRSAVLGVPIKIFAPQAWRPFLHIKDAARAITHCLRAPHEQLNRQVFNVITENYQKKDLADLAEKHFPKSYIDIIDKAADLRDYQVSDRRIRDQLGFTPSFTVEHAFLEVAQAIQQKVFLDPLWQGFSGVPEILRTAQT